MTKWYTAAAAAVALVALPAAGIYVGKRLAQPASEVRTEKSQRHAASDFGRALAEGRIVLGDLDGNGNRELVYFPSQGPPAIFVQAGGDYTSENQLSVELYRGATKFDAILASDYSEVTKKALLIELERTTAQSMRPLIAYAALQDPSLVLLCKGKMMSAGAATPLLAELCQADNVADLVLSPKAAAISLAVLGAAFLQSGNFAYTAPPSYAHWAQSGWNVDENGMVEVTPGCSVRITEAETLKIYDDFRRDPTVALGAGGLFRWEHPPGESREDYFRRLDRQAAAETQRRQFEQGAQQAYRQVSGQVQQWSQQTGAHVQQLQQQFDTWNRGLGAQAQQTQQDLGRQINSFNNQVQQMFQQKR